MSEYAVEKRETAPKNFFAGDFPTVPETGVAGAEIKEYAIGISAAAAGKGEPVTYYLTGEFFADALNLEASADLAKIKEALRKVSIFLK